MTGLMSVAAGLAIGYFIYQYFSSSSMLRDVPSSS